MKSVFFQKLKQTFRPRKAPADVSSSPGDTRLSNSDQTVRSGGSTPVVSDAATLIGAGLECDPPENLSKPRNYRLGGEVAHGGMGAILSAKDLNVRRTVAMKVMLSKREGSEDHFRRFVQEAQLTGQLEHPGIVPVHEVGMDEQGKPFYTMKFVKGLTLQDALENIKHGEPAAISKFPLAHLLTIFQKVCDAVAFAHSKGAVHRDLKRANIMIGDYGEVLVMDWG